jgi:secreted PhoX family phosphatase
MTDLDRRSFLTRTGALGGAMVGAGVVQALAGLDPAAATADREDRHHPAGYGPLAPRTARNEPDGFAYLALPAGFSYTVFGKVGAPMVSDPATRYAQAHDGMAAFSLRRGVVRLTRNQEDRNAPGAGSVGGPAATRYDPLGGGGVTVLDVDTRSGRVVNDYIGVNGTIINCAGGVAHGPDGWLTCEETIEGPERGWGRKHGYVFFVPARAGRTVPAVPLPALGRFSHEAVAFDCHGVLYLTEDAGSGRGSGLYRFVPGRDGRLDGRIGRGGRLEMLAVDGHAQADLREGQSQGERLPVRWVPVPEPDPDPVIDVERPGANSCFAQGWAAGGAKFNRLEGAWAAGDRILFASTSGGDAKNGDVNADGFAEGYGQIWEYRPRGRAGRGVLRLVYESPGGSVLDSPDNITITPRGGVLICEDDAGSADGDTHPLAPGITDVNRVIGLTPQGRPFEFAVNRFNSTELAGVCFSPDGRTMFFNIYGDGTPDSGMTCAVTGPWRRGPL